MYQGKCTGGKCAAMTCERQLASFILPLPANNMEDASSSVEVACVGTKRPATSSGDEDANPPKKTFPSFFQSHHGMQKSKSSLVKQLFKRMELEFEPLAKFMDSSPYCDKDSTVLLIDGGGFMGSLAISENHGLSKKKTVEAKNNGNILIRSDTIDAFMKRAVTKFCSYTKGFARVILVLDEAHDLPENASVHKKLERKARSIQGQAARLKTNEFCEEMVGAGGTAAFFGDAHFDHRVSKAYPGDTPLRPDLVSEIPTAANATDLRTAFATTDRTALMPGPYSALRSSRTKGRPELYAAIIARLIAAVQNGQAGDCVTLRVVGAHGIPVYEACSARAHAIDSEELIFSEHADKDDDEYLANASPGGTWTPPGFDGRHLVVFRGYDQDSAMKAFPFLDEPTSVTAPGIHMGFHFASIDAQGVHTYSESDHGVFMCANACSTGKILWPIVIPVKKSDGKSSSYNRANCWPAKENWRRYVVPRAIVVHSTDSDFFYLSLLWWCWVQTNVSLGKHPNPPLFWSKGVERRDGMSGIDQIISADSMARRLAHLLGTPSNPLAHASNRRINQVVLLWTSEDWMGVRKNVSFQKAPSAAVDKVMSAVMMILMGGFNDYMPGIVGIGDTLFARAMMETGILRTPFVTMGHVKQSRPLDPCTEAFFQMPTIVEDNVLKKGPNGFSVSPSFVTDYDTTYGKARAAGALFWVTICAKRKRTKKKDAPEPLAPGDATRAMADHWASRIGALADAASAGTIGAAELAQEVTDVPLPILGSTMYQFAKSKHVDDMPTEKCAFLLKAHRRTDVSGSIAAALCGLPCEYYTPSHSMNLDIASAEAQFSDNSKRPKVFPPPYGEACVRAEMALKIINLALALFEGQPKRAFSYLPKFYRDDGSFSFSASK